VHVRRAILPVVVLAAYLSVHRAPRLPGAIDDLPRPDHVLAVADAPATLDELRERIASVLEREHVPGAAIALVGRDGPMWIGGIGVRDLETRAPMEADTVFRVGSLTKSVIALGVMRLVDQGKLDVDRPLREILPDVAIDNPWEDVAPVTLAQCLEHTAGLDDVRFNEIFTEDERLSVRDTLRLNPRSRRIRWQPGTRHSYSNVGYTLAARAIEVASGEPFDVYLQREILAPLGIADADFGRTSAIVPRLATGYMEGDIVVPFQVFAHRPAGAMLASAGDLAKLVQFWITRGAGYPAIVSPAGLARIERSGTLPYPHLDSDYGFANYGDVAHPVLSRGHDGGMPGFHSSIRYFPELGVGYVMLLNANYSFRGYFELRALLFAYLTQGRTFTPPPAAAITDRPGADYFALANPRNELFGFIDRLRGGWRVRDVDDGLRVDELGGPSYDLVPAQDGGYRHPSECGSSVRFTTNRDGTPVLVTGFGYGEAMAWWPARLRYAALSLAMLLLDLAPLWAVGVLALGIVLRRRVMPHGLVLWPAVAALTYLVLPWMLWVSFGRGVIGEVHPLTIAVCALTILFAVASTASLVEVIRWLRRPDRPRLWLMVVPAACALVFFSLTVWLTANGWLGFRTWAW